MANIKKERLNWDPADIETVKISTGLKNSHEYVCIKLLKFGKSRKI